MSIHNPSGGNFNATGAWNGFGKYNPFDCVTNAGVGYCCYSGVPASLASAPALDGSNSTAGVVNLTSIAATLTTVNAVDLLVAVVQIEGTATVASVADTGTHTWTRRTQQLASNNTTEIWTAPAAAAVSGITITATFSAATGNNFSSSIVVFGISNYNSTTPFDANAGLPFHGTGTGALTVSTNYALDFLLWVSTNATSAGAQTLPTGFTQIALFSNTHGLNNVVFVVGYQATTNTLSSVAVQGGGGNTNNLNIVDAIQGAAAVSNPAPASDPAHWIG